MVVWQGITEGGTAVPVQITEEGKVVAIGETGPQGPPGPPGPPGQAEWPPNPIEGAFLVWLNGEPTWYTEQPIPTPPGSQGPIIQVDQNSLLLFENDVDENIFFKGIQVYAINGDGSNWDGGIYNTSRVWTSTVTGNTYSSAYPYTFAFNGSGDDFCQSGYPGSIVFTPLPTLPFTQSVVLRTVLFNDDLQKPKAKILISDALGVQDVTSQIPAGSADATTTITGLSSPITKIEWTSESNGNYSGVRYIEIDGKILLDPLLGPYPTGQISTVANNSALLSRVQGVWTEGLYMKADQSAQAAWLISKRKNGKILG